MVLQNRRKQEIVLMVITVSILAWGFFQNPQGQFSDIRGFYGMRFMDGEHRWPYTPHIPLGATSPLNPIEYPALTGLIVWALTFIELGESDPIMNYYYLNSLINAFLFATVVLLVARLTRPNLAILLALSPAAVRSLNLNWDIWAVLPMILALAFFNSKRYTSSAISLAIAIATKFFPIVLLLPIFVFFIKEKKTGDFFTYLAKTSSMWVAINLPFILIDYGGWSYFYRFSFQRTLGEGSFYTLFGKLGLPVNFPEISYYLLNILAFSALAVFLFKSKRNLDVIATGFLAVFAFTVFGKQYSMQYILWLAPLAILSLKNLSWSKNKTVFFSFLIWQVTEYLFHNAYFENLFSRVMVERGVEVAMTFSDERYGITALIRYISVAVFVATLASALIKEQTKGRRGKS